jgi:hypothetical protein
MNTPSEQCNQTLLLQDVNVQSTVDDVGMASYLEHDNIANTEIRKTNKNRSLESSHTENKKGRPKRGQKTCRTKEGRELVPLMVESCFIHSLSNVTCMQILGGEEEKRMSNFWILRKSRSQFLN